MKFIPLELEDVEHIVIHCSYTRPSQDIGVEEIRRWHRDRGWLDVGYHIIIRRDGTVESGRPHGVRGAHALGYNHNSVGICLIGGLAEDGDPSSGDAEDNFTPTQMAALRIGLHLMKTTSYPNAEAIGHGELVGDGRECPGFDVSTVR